MDLLQRKQVILAFMLVRLFKEYYKYYCKFLFLNSLFTISQSVKNHLSKENDETAVFVIISNYMYFISYLTLREGGFKSSFS